MSKFLKMGLLATSAVAVSLFGFSEAFGYGGGGGGGGGSPRSNTNFTLVINSGADRTTTTTVTLTLNGGLSATGMVISNTPDFDGTVVIPYQSQIPWILPSGAGEKTVYVKFFRANSMNTSPVLSDSIILDLAAGPIVAPGAPQEVLGVKITELDELIAATRRGQRSATVKALQDALKRAGFFPPGFPSTGFYGPVTDASVKRYLKSVTQLPVVPATLDALVGDLRFGLRGQRVVELQNALKARGFFPAYIRSTGYFGPITRAAVEKYLASKNS